ncbi:MAG: FAD-dependent oxidoreductase, partial [Chitinophagaceae bacterium]
MHRSNWIGLFVLLLGNLDLAAQRKANTNVLVIGASTGGTAAAIQCARMGVPTLLVESTPWLGGMLTSAGVSCTDGNDELWSGLWMEFREELYRHYGTRDLFTGWVSKTCFEPKVGDSIFKMMAAREKQLQIAWGWYFDRIIKSEERVTGALFRNQKGETLTVTARLTIDASDLGDAFASAGVAYDIGMEDKLYSQEAMAPGFYPVLQDLTWAATLQDYGPGADVTLARPPDYDSTNYFCCCTNAPCEQTSWPGSAQKMLDYGKLPLSPGQYQAKYMLNWPKFGNDDTLNAIAVPPIR